MTRYETGSAIKGSAVLLLALAVLAPLAGCSRGGGRNVGGRDYTVRGKVAQLPEPGNPASGFAVAHQAIDDFVDRQGEVVGMDPMTMTFALGPKVSLAGIAIEDLVELTLHVDWSATPPVRVTSVKKLPPGTPIVYRAAQPPGKKP
ncbi:MAG TPA: hypothetical protein VGR07_14650 [Thermoanaerobaculia bacterium]|jgi:hypothetical protein|nr:hypothetical protein [Thermoanaerobaculia bacterium]